MQPGDTAYKVFRRLTIADAAVTGKVKADFSMTAYENGALYSLTWNISEIGTGYYVLSYTTPPLGCVDLIFQPATGTDYIVWPDLSGEIENQDLDSIFSSVARPVVSLSGNGTIGQVTPINLYVFRYQQLTFNFKNSDGSAVDLSTYNNWRMSVRAEDQLTQYLDASAGSPTGFAFATSGGVLTVTLPEGAGTWGGAAAGTIDYLYQALLRGQDSLDLKFEITADKGSLAAQTVPMVASSKCTLLRREVGT